MPSTVSYNLHTDVELPPCDGPKLKRFRDPVEKIRFKGLLSSPIGTSSASSISSASSRSGGHGHVFEVEIDGESFALKIVSYFAAYAVITLIFSIVQVLPNRQGPPRLRTSVSSPG